MWFGTKQRLSNAQVSFLKKPLYKQLWLKEKKAHEISKISICRQSNYPTTENRTLAFGEQLLPLLALVHENMAAGEDIKTVQTQ